MSTTLPPLVVPRARARGLMPGAAVLLSALLAVVGAAVDGLTGSGLRAGFAVGFVLGAALAAFLVRVRHLRATVVAPPLVYAAVALTSAWLGGSGSHSMSRQGLQLFTELIVGAPVLVIGTVAALVVAVARHAGRR